MTDVTPWIDKVHRILKKLSTFVTLISLSLLKSTVLQGTGSYHKSVSQEEITCFTVSLTDDLFVDVLVVIERVINIQSDFSVPVSTSPAKNIKRNVEPLVNIAVDFVVLVTNFPRCHVVFHGLDHSGSSILICSANVDRVVTMKSLESGEDISRQDTTNQIPQMRHIVDVWKSRSNQDITLVSSGSLVVGA